MVCQDNDMLSHNVTIDGYLAGAILIVTEDKWEDVIAQNVNCLMTQTYLKIMYIASRKGYFVRYTIKSIKSF